jgi:hypothetical protein
VGEVLAMELAELEEIQNHKPGISLESRFI